MRLYGGLERDFGVRRPYVLLFFLAPERAQFENGCWEFRLSGVGLGCVGCRCTLRGSDQYPSRDY